MTCESFAAAVFAIAFCAVSAPSMVAAQAVAPVTKDATAKAAPDDKSAAQTKSTPGDSGAIDFGGYIEGYYGYNLGNPSNGITDFRAFDSRHNAVMLLNAVLATDWRSTRGYGRLALQFGTTADTYYGSEVEDFGAAGTGAHSFDVFKTIQEAYAGALFGPNSDVKVEAGVFLSPIGPENMAIKDQWTLSRSNLFFAFPFFHLGVRMIVPAGENTNVTVGAYNGWDSILDKNDQKTINVAVHHIFSNEVELDAQYFAGVERERGAAEGAPIRHLLDVWVKFHIHPRVQILLDFDGGFENGEMGMSNWLSGGVWTRWHLASEVYLATQSDFLTETRGNKGSKTASYIFFPTDWVSSHALCLEKRFGDFAAAKIEVRHDSAASNLYFKGQVRTDLTTGAFLANTRQQQTVTLALTSWF
jgi:hypothetical protein